MNLRYMSPCVKINKSAYNGCTSHCEPPRSGEAQAPTAHAHYHTMVHKTQLPEGQSIIFHDYYDWTCFILDINNIIKCVLKQIMTLNMKYYNVYIMYISCICANPIYDYFEYGIH